MQYGESNSNAVASNTTCPTKTAVVLPAFNAARTLRDTLKTIPIPFQRNVILCDDASSDGTAGLALKLGLRVLRHEKNLGYGANQKTLYQAALDTDCEYVAMLHPDAQYDGRLIPVATGVLETGVVSVVLGNRIRSRHDALGGGMPRWKYYANRSSTLVENLLLGTAIGDLHSGFRVYTRDALAAVPFYSFSNGFAFDQQMLCALAYQGFRVGDIPMPVRYFDEASSIGVGKSLRYALMGGRSVLEVIIARTTGLVSRRLAPREHAM